MTIEITEHTIGMWFLPLSDDSDYLAALELTPQGVKLTYRFRYHGEVTNPWAPNSNDRKSWYSGVSRTTPEEAIATVRALIAVLESSSGRQSYELLMHDGDVDRFTAELYAQPWANARIIPKEVL